MATLVPIKNLSRRRLRIGTATTLPAAAPTGSGAITYVDVDDQRVRRSLYRNLGSYAFAPDVIVAKVVVNAAAANGNGLAFAWQNAEVQPIFVHRAILDITTPGLATSTIDIGSTSTANGLADVTNIFSAQATSANGTFISNLVAKLAAADWVSGTFKTAAGTGIVANVYLHYSLV